MKNINKKGFTLVEMLVVMAIIGILMGLLFPAFTFVLRKAKITKAKTEISQIEQSWSQYLMDYKQAPTGLSGEQLMKDDMMKIITGSDVDQNPRKTMYLELPDDKPFGDPWYGKHPGDENIYRVSISVDPNQTAYTKKEVVKRVLVWSWGPDGIENTKDDIKNWH